MAAVEAAEEKKATAQPPARPLVSVIIPTFNSSRVIGRALKSVFAQTYGNLQIVIADDASRDDTARQVASFADDRIIFLPSEEQTNRGPAVARNRALARAEGEYIAFLDSDDEWFPEKLAKQVDHLDRHPDCSLVVTNAYDVSPAGEIIGTEFDPPHQPLAGAEAWRVLLKYSFIETTSVMTRLALVRELGGFDPALLVSQDQDLWIRLALSGDVGIIDEVQGRIHVTPTGHMTRNRRRQVDIMLPMIERHVARLSGRLSAKEIDDILGYRFQTVGRTTFFGRDYLPGIRLLVKASMHNGNWLSNAFYLCHANPLGVLLKSALKSATRRAV